MNMEELGYFVYMDQQEKKNAAAQREVKVETESDFKCERGTPEPDLE